jgi:hypothetical protein
VIRALAVVLAVVVLAGAPAAAAAEPPSPSPEPPATVVDNPFIPEDQNLSDCISALPRPGCGSEAHGGWRQALIFGLIVVAGAVIAWRLVRSLRRRDPPDGDGIRERRPREGSTP